MTVKYLGTYAATFVTMLVIDMLWLGVIARSLYAGGIGHLMSESPNLVAAAAFYLMFPLALLLFAVLPGAADGIVKVALTGALFGLFAYATYDLTNLATLKGWPVSLALIDMAWGALVSGVASAAGKFCFDAMK